ARQTEPALGGQVGTAIRIRDQRYLDPATFVHALAKSVRERGGRIREDVEVADLPSPEDRLIIGGEEYDAVGLATGARLTHLAHRLGVRRRVQAGRGYSFTVKIDDVPQGPVYFPTQRVACTPVGDRLRVAGMMEFRDVAAPADHRRIRALVDSAGVLLHGAHLEEREDEWVGARPCTADGLPLVGATRDPRIYLAGGHGMWGITLGPVTGKLLAEQIATGSTPEALLTVNPLR
ncbi:MAG: FAD-binding oxidoreductase, partial [Nocardioidaceae bacterium]|nr:FAD-binding oxidoreductase [Nocardioidaceae bacterium]